MHSTGRGRAVGTCCAFCVRPPSRIFPHAPCSQRLSRQKVQPRAVDAGACPCARRSAWFRHNAAVGMPASLTLSPRGCAQPSPHHDSRCAAVRRLPREERGLRACRSAQRCRARGCGAARKHAAAHAAAVPHVRGWRKPVGRCALVATTWREQARPAHPPRRLTVV